MRSGLLNRIDGVFEVYIYPFYGCRGTKGISPAFNGIILRLRQIAVPIIGRRRRLRLLRLYRKEGGKRCRQQHTDGKNAPQNVLCSVFSHMFSAGTRGGPPLVFLSDKGLLCAAGAKKDHGLFPVFILPARCREWRRAPCRSSPSPGRRGLCPSRWRALP